MYFTIKNASKLLILSSGLFLFGCASQAPKPQPKPVTKYVNINSSPVVAVEVQATKTSSNNYIYDPIEIDMKTLAEQSPKGVVENTETVTAKQPQVFIIAGREIPDFYEKFSRLSPEKREAVLKLFKTINSSLDVAIETVNQS